MSPAVLPVETVLPVAGPRVRGRACASVLGRFQRGRSTAIGNLLCVHLGSVS